MYALRKEIRRLAAKPPAKPAVRFALECDWCGGAADSDGDCAVGCGESDGVVCGATCLPKESCQCEECA